jgi:hypothetical protein
VIYSSAPVSPIPDIFVKNVSIGAHIRDNSKELDEDCFTHDILLKNHLGDPILFRESLKGQK